MPNRTFRRSAVASAVLCAAVLAGCARPAPSTSGTMSGPAPSSQGGADRVSTPNATRGTASAPDENIKTERAVNTATPPANIVAPASKAEAGTATRGQASCMVRFDNRSRLYIATYADGQPAGTLSPYGDVYTYVIAGPTRLYARAGFDDGSVSTWGPVTVDCPAGGSHTWRLRFVE